MDPVTDPAEHNVDVVLAYATEHPEEIDRLRDAEELGKGRKTLLTGLNELRQAEAVDPEPTPMPDPPEEEPVHDPEPDDDEPDLESAGEIQVEPEAGSVEEQDELAEDELVADAEIDPEPEDEELPVSDTSLRQEEPEIQPDTWEPMAITRPESVIRIDPQTTTNTADFETYTTIAGLPTGDFREEAATVVFDADLKLRKGDRGDLVRELQRRLKGCAVTGRYGSATEKAVRKVQESANLPVTGVVDAATFAAVLG